MRVLVVGGGGREHALALDGRLHAQLQARIHLGDLLVIDEEQVRLRRSRRGGGERRDRSESEREHGCRAGEPAEEEVAGGGGCRRSRRSRSGS